MTGASRSERTNGAVAGAADGAFAISVDASGGVLSVAPAGDLVAATIAEARAAVARAITGAAPRTIRLDLSAIRRLDASGVSLAVHLHRLAKSAGGAFEATGGSADLRLIVELALRGQDPQPAAPRRGVVREVGGFAIALWEGLVDLVRFIGEIAIVLVRIARTPRLLRVGDTIAATARHGTDAIGVVCLLGFLIGAIIAFQTFDPLAKYGAKLQVADVVAISIVRELGPLITAIILAGRSGSAFAAEIGTMKVTQELDALRTFGIDPVRFLVIPRLLAVVLATPLLSVFASIMGVAGGYVILGPEGFSTTQYLNEVKQALTVGGFLQGLFKTGVFAVLVAGIGCLAGLRTGEGPGAVGLSTTRAVVAGIVAIVVADSILGSFFYALGI